MNDEELEWDKFQFLFNYFINYNKDKRKKKKVHLYRCRGIIGFRSLAEIKIQHNDFLNKSAFDMFYHGLWNGNDNYKSANRDYECLSKQDKRRYYNLALASFKVIKYNENFGRVCRNYYNNDRDFKNEVDETLKILNYRVLLPWRGMYIWIMKQFGVMFLTIARSFVIKSNGYF